MQVIYIHLFYMQVFNSLSHKIYGLLDIMFTPCD
uniref:Uncharacterized protein n=1 Tax=Arundo donax TaxID=35708 RepID=A0A0A9G030_ARUDO